MLVGVGVASLPPSFSPSRIWNFTVATGKTAFTFATQCNVAILISYTFCTPN